MAATRRETRLVGLPHLERHLAASPRRSHNRPVLGRGGRTNRTIRIRERQGTWQAIDAQSATIGRDHLELELFDAWRTSGGRSEAAARVGDPERNDDGRARLEGSDAGRRSNWLHAARARLPDRVE